MNLVIKIEGDVFERDSLRNSSLIKSRLHRCHQYTVVFNDGDPGTNLGMEQGGTGGAVLKDALAWERAISLMDGNETQPGKIQSKRKMPR